MQIDSIKDLEAVINLCRRKGVTSIEIDNIKLALGDKPERKAIESTEAPKEQEPVLTDEQILLWSAGSLGAE
jgi:hypothetical protein